VLSSTRSGTALLLELSLSLIDQPGAHGRYVLVLARDVTERVQAQRTLQERTQELVERSELLDLAQDAIFIRDFQTGSIRCWNRGAEQLYGWPAADALGLVSHVLLSTRFPEPLEAIERALVVTGTWEGELVHTARDAREVVVASRWVLHKDDTGTPSAIPEVNTDITERQRSDVVLRDQAALLDLAPDAIYVREFATGKIRFWNRGAKSLYGWSQAEALDPASQVLVETRFPVPLARIETELQASGHWQGELEQRSGDGRWVTVASRWALRRDEQHRPSEILVSNTDIAERKRAEAELARLAAAEAALNERDHLLATVSHDLKTPLTAIRGPATRTLRAGRPAGRPTARPGSHVLERGPYRGRRGGRLGVGGSWTGVLGTVRRARPGPCALAQADHRPGGLARAELWPGAARGVARAARR
jgi:PAS domain S-box-containing protein